MFLYIVLYIYAEPPNDITIKLSERQEAMKKYDMWRLVAMMGLTSLMLVVIIQAQSDELDSLDPLSLKETMEIVETCLFYV